MKRKQSCFITLYLVIAITGAFTFSAAETLHIYEDKDDLASPGGFFSSVGHTIDCLAENTVAISRGSRHSSSFIRSGYLSTFALSNIQNTGTYFAGSSLHTADEYHVPISKNTILIKLRI